MALLDSIATKLAYDLKKLRAAYGGACLRVRREMGGDPALDPQQDIGFHSSGNLDWATALTFATVSGVVYPLACVKQYDQSGNGIDRVQTTPANQPILDLTNKEIDFDGVNKFFVTSAPVNLTTTDKVSVFHRTKLNSTGGTMLIYELSGNASAGGVFGFNSYLDSGAIDVVLHVQDFDIKRFAPDTAYHTFSTVFDRNNVVPTNQVLVWQDGVSTGTSPRTDGNAGGQANFINDYLYFGTRGGAGFFFNGSQPSFILMATAPTTVERTAIEASLGVQNADTVPVVPSAPVVAVPFKWSKAQIVPTAALVAWNALDESTAGADGAADYSGNSRALTASSNAPALQSIERLNNQKALYFDGSTSNPIKSTGAVNIKHLFIVAAFEDALFPAGYAGLFSGVAAGDVLIGNAGTDSFFNYAYGDYQYRKNDVSFLQSNQKAPVGGNFGIIEVVNGGGFGLDGIQIGRQTNITARRWKGWFAESLCYSSVKNDCERLAIYRYLAMKFHLWRQAANGLNIFPFPNSQRTPGQSFVNGLESTSISGAFKGRTKSGLIRSFDVGCNFRRQEEWDAAEAFWFANKNRCVLEDNSFYPARQFTGRITSGLSRDPQSINNQAYKFGFVTT